MSHSLSKKPTTFRHALSLAFDLLGHANDTALEVLTTDACAEEARQQWLSELGGGFATSREVRDLHEAAEGLIHAHQGKDRVGAVLRELKRLRREGCTFSLSRTARETVAHLPDFAEIRAHQLAGQHKAAPTESAQRIAEMVEFARAAAALLVKLPAALARIHETAKTGAETELKQLIESLK